MRREAGKQRQSDKENMNMKITGENVITVPFKHKHKVGNSDIIKMQT